MAKLSDVRDLAVLGAIGVGAYLLWTYLGPAGKPKKPSQLPLPPPVYVPPTPQPMTPEQVALYPAYEYFVSPLGQIGDAARQAADTFQATLAEVPLVGNPLADVFNASYSAGYQVGQAAFKAGESAGEAFGSFLKSIGL